MKILLSIILSIILLLSLNAQEKVPEFPPDDVDFTMDRDQMLWQLGITFPELPVKMDDPNNPDNAWPSDSTNPNGNWRNAENSFIARSGFALWSNYNQEKAGEYTNIDLVKMNDGTIIETAEEWWQKRRMQVKNAVENEIWGVIPPDSILPSSHSCNRLTYRTQTRTLSTRLPVCLPIAR